MTSSGMKNISGIDQTALRLIVSIPTVRVIYRNPVRVARTRFLVNPT